MGLEGFGHPHLRRRRLAQQTPALGGARGFDHRTDGRDWLASPYTMQTFSGPSTGDRFGSRRSIQGPPCVADPGSQLYAEASRRNIRGRSLMNKAELKRKLGR